MVVEKEVEKISKGENSENDNDDEVSGYTLVLFIDKNSGIKKQILIEPNFELSDYIKPPYPILKK